MFAPLSEEFLPVGIDRMSQRTVGIAFNKIICQINHHIICRPDFIGRRYRGTVTEGADDDFRILFADLSCNMVDVVQKKSGLGAVKTGNFFTFRTKTQLIGRIQRGNIIDDRPFFPGQSFAVFLDQ